MRDGIGALWGILKSREGLHKRWRRGLSSVFLPPWFLQFVALQTLTHTMHLFFNKLYVHGNLTLSCSCVQHDHACSSCLSQLTSRGTVTPQVLHTRTTDDSRKPSRQSQCRCLEASTKYTTNGKADKQPSLGHIPTQLFSFLILLNFP